MTLSFQSLVSSHLSLARMCLGGRQATNDKRQVTVNKARYSLC